VISREYWVTDKFALFEANRLQNGRNEFSKWDEDVRTAVEAWVLTDGDVNPFSDKVTGHRPIFDQRTETGTCMEPMRPVESSQRTRKRVSLPFGRFTD
jgi:hypothetical protein